MRVLWEVKKVSAGVCMWGADSGRKSVLIHKYS